ncbi:recombinase family protein, partial [Streptomyces sp. NPDC051976]|uniref:recombinase family protein n=1 Tax=Streptomyces sp. NPDC051976 TaxID=3154947 RepID=UPI00343AB4E9
VGKRPRSPFMPITAGQPADSPPPYAHQLSNSGIGSQTAALRAHAAASHLELPEEWVFEDEGHSRATLVRPALERLRDLVAQVGVDVVLCYAPDRLARKFAYQALLIEEFARAGTRVEFGRGPRSDTPEDQLMVQFQGMFAEYEKAQLMERYRRGKTYRARSGSINVLGGARSDTDTCARPLNAGPLTRSSSDACPGGDRSTDTDPGLLCCRRHRRPPLQGSPLKTRDLVSHLHLGSASFHGTIWTLDKVLSFQVRSTSRVYDQASDRQPHNSLRLKTPCRTRVMPTRAMAGGHGCRHHVAAAAAEPLRGADGAKSATGLWP